MAAPTPAEQDKLLRRYLSEKMANWYGKSGRLWIDDTKFVVNEIERLGAEAVGVFAGKLDLAHLGVAGMSFGGKIMPRFCAEDTRCKAGLDLDGGLPLLEALDTPPTQPIMVMYPAGRRPRYDLFYSHLPGTVYRVGIQRTVHAHFFEFGLAANPLLKLRLLDAGRSLSIINDYALAFFNQYLTGKSSTLISGPAPYPEVDFERRGN
jgi:poly(3-hydroxybutyrate) depolymerase